MDAERLPPLYVTVDACNRWTPIRWGEFEGEQVPVIANWLKNLVLSYIQSSNSNHLTTPFKAYIECCSIFFG